MTEPLEDSPTVELLLLRHAKSAWPAGVDDADRPLNARGVRAAGAVGRFLAANGLVPDVVVASPARRTTETARLVLDAAGAACELRFDPRIYDDEVLVAASAAVAAAPAARVVAVVGHEPGVVDATRALCGARVRVPTGCLVWLTVVSPVRSGAGVLRLVLPPRLLSGV